MTGVTKAVVCVILSVRSALGRNKSINALNKYNCLQWRIQGDGGLIDGYPLLPFLSIYICLFVCLFVCLFQSFLMNFTN